MKSYKEVIEELVTVRNGEESMRQVIERFVREAVDSTADDYLKIQNLDLSNEAKIILALKLGYREAEEKVFG